MVIGGERRQVRLTNGGNAFKVAFLDENRSVSLTDIDWRPGLPNFTGALDGRIFTAQVKPAAEGFYVRHRAAAGHVLVLTPRSAELH